MEQCLDHVGWRRAIVRIEKPNKSLQVSVCEGRIVGDREFLAAQVFFESQQKYSEAIGFDRSQNCDVVEMGQLKTWHDKPDRKCGLIKTSVNLDLPPAIASYFSF